MSTLQRGYAPPPTDDDFDPEPLPFRRRPRVPLLTAALLLAAVAAGAFVGGVEIQKHFGGSGSSSGSATGGGAGAISGARGGTAAGGFGGAGGGLTVGRVTAVKGRTFTVTDTNGNRVKVTTSPASQISRTGKANPKTIRPGQTVVVRGATSSDGTVKATSITIGGPAGGGGFGGRGRNFGGGG